MTDATFSNFQMAKPPTFNPGLQAGLLGQIATQLDGLGRANVMGTRRTLHLNYGGAPYTVDIHVSGFNAAFPGGGQYQITLYDIS